MTYELEITVAPSAIERAMAVFENFKATGSRPACPGTQGALTDHIFGQLAAGETDEQKLVVSGPAHLKSLERMVEASKP